MRISMIHNRGARLGHQVHNYFSVLAFCRSHGAEFCFTPFSGRSLKWNDVLRFDLLHTEKEVGSGVVIKSFHDILKVKADHYIVDLNQSDFDIKSAPANKEIKLRLFDEHREKLYPLFREKNPYPKKNNIAIHIRRGDVSFEGHPGRFLPISFYRKVLDQVYEGQNVFVLSESNLEDVHDLEKYKPVILKNTSDIEAFYFMVNSDVLVCSKSGFSAIAHILGYSKCYYSSRDWAYFRADAVRCEE